MRCRRSEQIELDAFLLGAAGDETVDAFREHYPRCAACSSVVAGWMALEDALRDVMVEAGEHGSAHPEPADLARYAEAPARMGEKAMQIESHVAGCASCANELVLIRGFDPAVFAAGREAMPAAARERATATPGLLDGLRGALAAFVERLRGFELLAPAPALALAVVILAGLWWSGALEGRSGGPAEPSGPQLVEQRVPAPGSAPGMAPDGASGGAAGAPEGGPELAPAPEAGAPMLAERSDAVPEPAQSGSTAAEGGEPAVVAQADGAAPSGPGASAPNEPPATSGGRSAPTEEILLAAVEDLPPPSYATPAGAESLVWMRQFGAVRAAPGAAKVSARAPGDHTGLTLSRTPRLWWYLEQRTDLPVQLTIVDGEAIEPLVRVELPGPHAAGLHAFDLSAQGVTLAPGVDYRWFVSVVVDPDRPSRNPVSAGSLRVAADADARRQTVSSAAAPARGNTLAELGLWYDAFDFYASLAAAHPEVERLAAYRDRLIEAARSTP